MTIPDLGELQGLVFRTWVRNVMFLVTLPYHLSQGASPKASRARAPAVAGEDARWLR